MAGTKGHPAGPFLSQTADVTRWLYDPASGVLLGKRDAADLGYSYTWLDSGRLATRTNARDTVTTHTDHPSGDLASVAHNDGVTPGYRRDGAAAPHASNSFTTCPWMSVSR